MAIDPRLEEAAAKLSIAQEPLAMFRKTPAL